MPGKITEALHSWEEAVVQEQLENCTCNYMVDTMEGEEP